jgi:hypothetical protein
MFFFSIIVAPWPSGPGCSPKLNGAGQKLFGRHRFRRNQTGDQHPHRPPGRPRRPLHAPGTIDYAVPTVTTLAGARAAVEGIATLQQQRQVEVIALQDIYEPWGG